MSDTVEINLHSRVSRDSGGRRSK